MVLTRSSASGGSVSGLISASAGLTGLGFRVRQHSVPFRVTVTEVIQDH